MLYLRPMPTPAGAHSSFVWWLPFMHTATTDTQVAREQHAYANPDDKPMEMVRGLVGEGAEGGRAAAATRFACMQLGALNL